MTNRFEARQWVPFPVELVFAFFANPNNLPHLIPPAQQARIEDLRIEPPPPRPSAADPAKRFRSIAAGAGSEILISFTPLRWVPRRVSWMARIVEFAWNSHFVDEQVRGPFKQLRHRHGVTPELRDGTEGTLVSDELDYELPGGPLGLFADPLVRRQMKQGFAFRHQRLPQILAVAARQAVEKGPA